MINQRGQAFSVFELLIAAIVAIAILFVLLPIISGIILPVGDPIQSIGNKISSNNNTLLFTEPFAFGRNQTIDAGNFESKIDPCAIFFDASDFKGSRIDTTPYEINDNGKCTASAFNKTNGSVKAVAAIVCAQDGESLQNKLDNLKDGAYSIPGDWDDEDMDYTKICAIILRPSS